MMAKSHIAIGLTSYVAFIGLTTQKFLLKELLYLGPIIWIFVFLGAITPDLDYAHSSVGKRFRLLSKMITAITPHRGLTHSLISLAVIMLLYMLFSQYEGYLLAFGIGVLSHILADMLTDSGVMLFFPFRKRVGISLFSTNSYAEPIFVLIICLTTWGYFLQ